MLIKIKVDDLKIEEGLVEFLRANFYINSAVDMSRLMKRSRNYMTVLRYNGHRPSVGAYRQILPQLEVWKTEASDADLKHCFDYFIDEISEIISTAKAS